MEIMLLATKVSAQRGYDVGFVNKVVPNGEHEKAAVEMGQELAQMASGPIIFNSTFAWAIHNDATLHAPGLPIFIASGLLLAAFLLAVTVGHAPHATATAAAE